MKIFVVGAGKLANAILNADLSFDACNIEKWDNKRPDFNEKAIVIHAGSGRQAEECFKFCSQTKSVLVELSTGLETEKQTIDFPLIICPNTSVLVLKMLHLLQQNDAIFSNYNISITESHQASKKTEAGTAFAFAKALHFPVNEIESIRDAEIQKEQIKIPDQYLDRHAYHRIVLRDGNDEIAIETKVLGHQSYVAGIKKIIAMILSNPLENKSYTILDFIQQGVL